MPFRHFRRLPDYLYRLMLFFHAMPATYATLRFASALDYRLP